MRFGAYLGPLGPGLFVGAIVVLLLLNIGVLMLRRGQASPALLAANITAIPATPTEVETAAPPTPAGPTPSAATPTATSATETATATSTASAKAIVPAAATPTVVPVALRSISPPEGQLPFVSSALPYAVTYPASWSVQPGLAGITPSGATKGPFRGDVFLQIAPAGSFRASVAVIGEAVSGSLTPSQYVNAVLSGGQDPGLSAAQPLGQYPVGGMTALLLALDRTDSSGRRTAQVRAFFTTPGVGWSLLLTTTPERLAGDTATLLWMMDQFTLRR